MGVSPWCLPYAIPLTRLALWAIHPLPDGERNRGEPRPILLPIGEKVARSSPNLRFEFGRDEGDAPKRYGPMA